MPDAMDAAELASRFAEAHDKVVSARSLIFASGERYGGPPVRPAGIVAWETVAPDFKDRGKIRYFLVVAEHVDRKDWPSDDGSFPPDTEGVVLAEMTDDLDFMFFEEDSQTLTNLTFEHCEAPGTMESLRAQYERTRNFRVRVVFSASGLLEEPERALAVARGSVQESGLPADLEKYVDVLLTTEDQGEFRKAAFEIWNQEDVVNKHLVQLANAMIVPLTRGIDAVGTIWICRQMCALDCPAGALAPYAVLLCQHSLDPPISDSRRTLQWAAIEGLMEVTSRLPEECAPAIVDAIDAELALEDPYEEFIRHAIYILGAIGLAEVRPTIDRLAARFPAAAAEASANFGTASPYEIKAKVESGSQSAEKAGCLGLLFFASFWSVP